MRIRNPVTTLDPYTLASALGGLLNVALIYIAAYVLVPGITFELGGPLSLILRFVTDLGFFAMGAVPVYGLLRYRLVTPVVWSGLLTTFALVDQHSFHPFVALYSLFPLTYTAVAIAISLGVAESQRRDSVPSLSTDSLV